MVPKGAFAGLVLGMCAVAAQGCGGGGASPSSMKPPSSTGGAVGNGGTMAPFPPKPPMGSTGATVGSSTPAGAPGSSSSSSASAGSSASSGSSSSSGASASSGSSSSTGASSSSGGTGGGGGSSSGGGGSSSGGGGGGGGGSPSLTKIYINSAGGTIYEYDSANWQIENVIARSTGAFSISSGPLANTLYLQISSFSSGPLGTCNVVTHGLGTIGGSVPGNALGEGRDGFLYAGSGVELYRVNPNSGQSTYVGDGQWPYAGDLAVDPTSMTLFGAVDGQWTVDLVTVDRATGRQTVVGPLGVSGEIWGLGFSANGDLFAGGTDGNGGGSIFRIDKSTGHAMGGRHLSYEPYDMATQPYAVDETDPSAPGVAAARGAGTGTGEAPLGPAIAGGTRTYFSEDFEGAAPTLGGFGSGLWEVGAPSAGPGAAASGARCLATRAEGGYPRFALESVETAPLSLEGAEHPVLVIRHWYGAEEGRDGGLVRARTAMGLVALAPEGGYAAGAVEGLLGAPGFSGRSGGWRETSFDLSALAGERDVRIVFTFGSDGEGDGASAGAGWFIDDVRVVEARRDRRAR